MTTVINTPPRESSDSGAGWAVATIILILVIGLALYFWGDRIPAQSQQEGANINITLPEGSGNENNGGDNSGQ